MLNRPILSKHSQFIKSNKFTKLIIKTNVKINIKLFILITTIIKLYSSHTINLIYIKIDVKMFGHIKIAQN